jgi:hypothetical protein
MTYLDGFMDGLAALSLVYVFLHLIVSAYQKWS